MHLHKLHLGRIEVVNILAKESVHEVVNAYTADCGCAPSAPFRECCAFVRSALISQCCNPTLIQSHTSNLSHHHHQTTSR